MAFLHRASLTWQRTALGPYAVMLAGLCLAALPLLAQGPDIKASPIAKLNLPDFSTLVWHPDGKLLAIQSDRYEKAGPGQTPNWHEGRVKISTVKVVDAETGKEKTAFPAVSGRLIRLKGFAGDGKSVVVLRFDLEKEAGIMEWWNLEKLETQHSIALEDTKGMKALSPDGKTLVCGVSDGAKKRPRWMIGVWNVATGKQEGAFGDFPYEPAFCVSPDSKLLAVGHLSLTRDSVQLWDHATGKVKVTMARAGFSGSLRLAFAPDGKTLLGAGGAGGLHRWDVKTGELLPPFQGNKARAFTAEFSHDGSLILCNGWGEQERRGERNKWEAKVLNARTGAVVKVHQDTTPACSFVPKQNAWAVHSEKGQVTIWKLE